MYGLKPTKNFFPECVASSKGSRFTLFGGGAVFATHCTTVRNRPQPSATVRNRAREVAMAVPSASFTKVVTFGGFKRRAASFRLAGVALCDIPTCFRICPKSFSVAGAMLFHRFRRCVALFLARTALW